MKTDDKLLSIDQLQLGSEKNQPSDFAHQIQKLYIVSRVYSGWPTASIFSGSTPRFPGCFEHRWTIQQSNESNIVFYPYLIHIKFLDT